MAQAATMTDEVGSERSRAQRAQAGGGKPLALRLVEFAYVALVGVLIVRLVHAIIAPLEAPIVADDAPRATRLDADPAVFARYDPFGSAAQPDEPVLQYADAAETTLDLELNGTTFGGGTATALITMPDRKQRPFAVGDEVMRGVTLRDVLPDQAILSRNGVTETLTLAGRDSQRGAQRGGRGSPSPPRDLPASAGAGAGPVSPAAALQTLTQAFQFRPVAEEEGVAYGYALYPGGQPQLFRASGFAPGDIVTAVDGIPAPSDPEGMLELMADLPPGRPFTVTVERQGLALDVPVDLSRATP